MENAYLKIKESVDDNHTPIPNSIWDYSTFDEKLDLEFSGFLLRSYAECWKEMEKTKGKSEWKCTLRNMKKEKGVTKNKIRKYTTLAFSIGAFKSFTEDKDGNISIEIDPKEYVGEVK